MRSCNGSLGNGLESELLTCPSVISQNCSFVSKDAILTSHAGASKWFAFQTIIIFHPSKTLWSDIRATPQFLSVLHVCAASFATCCACWQPCLTIEGFSLSVNFVSFMDNWVTRAMEGSDKSGNILRCFIQLQCILYTFL